MVECDLCREQAQSYFEIDGSMFDYAGCGKHAIYIRKLLTAVFPGKNVRETLLQ